jgi:hypothetical protein
VFSPKHLRPILQSCLLFFLPTFTNISLRSTSFEQGSPKPSPIYALQCIPYPPAQEEVPLDSYFPDLLSVPGWLANVVSVKKKNGDD